MNKKKRKREEKNALTLGIVVARLNVGLPTAQTCNYQSVTGCAANNKSAFTYNFPRTELYFGGAT